MSGMSLISLLPRVEDPIPDAIGVGIIFSTAGAGGVVMLVLGSMLGLSTAELDAWARRGRQFGVCGRSIVLRDRAGRPDTMKTMHRNSNLGLAIGSVLTAVVALVLTALTDTGAGGAYAFLFVGMFIFMAFLIWPERTRPLRGGRRHSVQRPRTWRVRR